jgi:hypothetical protein
MRRRHTGDRLRKGPSFKPAIECRPTDRAMPPCDARNAPGHVPHHARDFWPEERNNNCCDRLFSSRVFMLPHELFWVALQNKKSRLRRSGRRTLGKLETRL